MLFQVLFRDVQYNHGSAYKDGVFTSPFSGLFAFYVQMRSSVSQLSFLTFNSQCLSSEWVAVLLHVDGSMTIRANISTFFMFLFGLKW